ncbi:hypothetical protein EDD85DRAFT_793380 [Armillaria nabsnona]|nr:hypothetical protein EDD85DRAFT_793380 [Armillaria nabsnona]
MSLLQFQDRGRYDFVGRHQGGRMENASPGVRGFTAVREGGLLKVVAEYYSLQAVEDQRSMAVTVVSIRSPFLPLANPDNTDSFQGPSQKFASIANSQSKPKSNPKYAYPQLL